MRPETGNVATSDFALLSDLHARTSAMKAAEVASLLGISRTEAYRLAESGRIPSFRIGCSVRFDPRAVARWLAQKLT
jgi:excisionase family DNA binding protein